LALLQEHKLRLNAKGAQIRIFLRTIDRTIDGIKGDTEMNVKDLYTGFSADKQNAYVEDLVNKLGEDQRAEIESTRNNFDMRSADGKTAVMQMLADIEGDLVNQMLTGTAADSVDLDDLLTLHRTWISDMWEKPCSSAAYSGMAELYTSTPDFRTRYETLGECFTDYLCAAMRAHNARIS
jgi:hypothetical protein